MLEKNAKKKLGVGDIRLYINLREGKCYRNKSRKSQVA